MIVAGIAPLPPRWRGGGAWESAYEAARAFLATPEVSLVYKVKAGQVWWIASRTADQLPPTLLAAALDSPGMVIEGEVAVANTGTDLLCRMNTLPALEKWAEELGLSVRESKAKASWVSHERLKANEERWLWRWGLVSGWVACVLAAGYLAAQMSIPVPPVKPVAQEGDVVSRVVRLSEVTALAASTGGQVLTYDYAGGAEKVAMLLPPGSSWKSLQGAKGEVSEQGVMVTGAWK